MAYPRDTRARPDLETCAVSASDDIKLSRDSLVGRAVVCQLNGNSHDTSPPHVEAALWDQLGIHKERLQVLKHHPEQYLAIFSDSRDRQRVVRQGAIPHRGRIFNFEAWTEQRYGSLAHWEFRVRLRIEGVPIHAWKESIVSQVIGKLCSIHYVDGHTHCREHTRTYDLWAWSINPSGIAKEVWLTITDPDEFHSSDFQVHHSVPTGLKFGLSYKLLIHVDVVEDLSFIEGRNIQDRRRRREFEWNYGVPDSLGEKRVKAVYQDAGRKGRYHRRDDEDREDSGRGGRHLWSRSWWDGRGSHCRGAVDDLRAPRGGVNR
jgi:hypothetical protein